MPRPRTVYRGKRKYSWIITLLAMLVVVAVVLSSDKLRGEQEVLLPRDPPVVLEILYVHSFLPL